MAQLFSLGIMQQLYENGSEIHVGDVVTYNGQRGEVMFVADRREYSATYPESDWPPSRHPTGFMIEFSNGARAKFDYPDELLEFVSKKTDR